MTNRKTAAIVLAAGQGTRMKSATPKVLHRLAGRAMISHVTDTLSALAPERVVVVIAPAMEAVAEEVAPLACAVQDEQLGTAHAALCARDALKGFDGDVLVVFGDNPLIPRATLEAMLAELRAPESPAVVVLGFCPEVPGGYGRLILGRGGALEEIVEVKEATPEQLALGLCNSGVIAADCGRLFELAGRVGNDNAKGEYYLTDIVGLARSEGLECAVVEGDERELVGIDSRSGLAAAEAIVQRRLRRDAMAAGATLIDPETVYLSEDTELGQDVTVGPHVVFGPGVTVGAAAEIRAFCHIEGAVIEERAVIGPFARLRPGARIAENAHVGNFVEIKNAVVEAGAKVNHLSYIGDARVGSGANVGAGTITCNYDGFMKHHTDIGAGAFIGSNSALVAPVKIGDGAVIGAGSVITRDVDEDALALTRAELKEIKGGAESLRRRKRAEKAEAGKNRNKDR